MSLDFRFIAKTAVYPRIFSRIKRVWKTCVLINQYSKSLAIETIDKPILQKEKKKKKQR